MKGSEPPSTLRFLTYNIHGCIGRGGIYDFNAILQVLRGIDADIVALQEVYDEEPEDRQFLKALEEEQYPEIIYSQTLLHETRGAYGNILLSKWPVSKIEEIDLTVGNFEPRGAIRGRVTLPNATIDLTTTHLGLNRNERATQIAKLLQHWNLPDKALNRRNLFVFMGDLNEWRPGRNILSILNRQIAATPHLRTFPAMSPAFALDRIYARPNRLLERIYVVNTTLTRRASDHLPLIADLTMNAGARPRLV